MKSTKTERGFIVIEHITYPKEMTKRLIQESSAIGDYEDSFSHPGSSFLWIDENFHLNREEVQQFIDILKHWLENKRLPNDI